MIKELTQIEVDSVIKDDPVRPHIPSQFRTLGNNTVYALYEDKYAEFDEPSDDIRAVICVAYTNMTPTNEQELQSFPSGDIAVFYTVWSYDRGAGRDIVFTVAKHVKDTKEIF